MREMQILMDDFHKLNRVEITTQILNDWLSQFYEIVLIDQI